MSRGSIRPSSTIFTCSTIGMYTSDSWASWRMGATDASPSAVWFICFTTSWKPYPWPSRRPAVLLRLRGDWQVAIRSPSPANPWSVSGLAPFATAKSVISTSPRVMIDALVFSP